jgi:1-acyl-sn-glycerol-3-phosphate acyltransferase
MYIDTAQTKEDCRTAQTAAKTQPAELRRDLRSIILVIFAVLATGAGIVCAFISLLFDRSANACHSIVARLWARLLVKVSDVRVEVEGEHNFDPNRPHVFMANHQSHYDIFAILGFLPVQVRFMAKKELYRIPVFGWTLHAIGHIQIDRYNPRRASASYFRAAERIRNGTSVFIFPEGTRSPDARLLPFKKGGFVLAIKAGVPIVPISISGGCKVLPKHKLVLRRGVIKMVIDKPIDTREYQLENKKDLIARVKNVIISNLREDEVDVLNRSMRSK